MKLQYARALEPLGHTITVSLYAIYAWSPRTICASSYEKHSVFMS